MFDQSAAAAILGRINPGHQHRIAVGDIDANGGRVEQREESVEIAARVAWIWYGRGHRVGQLTALLRETHERADVWHVI